MNYPRFTQERRYVNRSGSLSDPDQPEMPEESRRHDLSEQGEDDYHRNLDAERGERT